MRLRKMLNIKAWFFDRCSLVIFVFCATVAYLLAVTLDIHTNILSVHKHMARLDYKFGSETTPAPDILILHNVFNLPNAPDLSNTSSTFAITIQPSSRNLLKTGSVSANLDGKNQLNDSMKSSGIIKHPETSPAHSDGLFSAAPSIKEIVRKLQLDNKSMDPFMEYLHRQMLLTNALINNGGIGNQLFQYAGLLALSVKYDRYPVIRITEVPQIYEYFDLHISITNLAVDWPNPVIFSSCVGCFDRYEELSNSTKGNQIVHAYFQSHRYIDPILDVLKNFEFRHKADISAAASAIMDNVRTRNCRMAELTVKCLVIGVHNRRGDITEKFNTDLGFAIADVDYFNRTMSHFVQKYGEADHIVFAVISNDYRWSVENIRTKLGALFNVVVLETAQNPAVDQCFLTLCDHLIITTGTYGWWAGKLGRGDVAYLKDYPMPGSVLATKEFPVISDYYPAHWVAM